MTYVVITFIVLVILNIYCSITCQQLFYQSKRQSMIEKCLLVSDEIATLDVLNNTSIATVVGQMESLKVTRLIVTDQSAKVLYDSSNEALGHYSLFPEILTAIDGNDVCSWRYRDGSTDACAATPIVYYGTIVGSVYMAEFETAQGAMIQSLQKTVLQITLLLEIVVILFSMAFANTFSRRLNRIMTSMRIIQEGDYTHKVNMGGNDELTILGNEFITLLKDTALIYTIGGEELLYAAKAISTRTYEQMFPLVGTAILYLILVLIFTWLQGILERRLRQSDRR